MYPGESHSPAKGHRDAHRSTGPIGLHLGQPGSQQVKIDLDELEPTERGLDGMIAGDRAAVLVGCVFEVSLEMTATERGTHDQHQTGGWAPCYLSLAGQLLET